MTNETRNQLKDKELRKAVSRALRKVEKMIREEPQQITIICDGDNSNTTASEIQEWLFKRRQDNDNKIVGRISRK